MTYDNSNVKITGLYLLLLVGFVGVVITVVSLFVADSSRAQNAITQVVTIATVVAGGLLSFMKSAEAAAKAEDSAKKVEAVSAQVTEVKDAVANLPTETKP